PFVQIDRDRPKSSPQNPEAQSAAITQRCPSSPDEQVPNGAPTQRPILQSELEPQGSPIAPPLHVPSWLLFAPPQTPPPLQSAVFLKFVFSAPLEQVPTNDPPVSRHLPAVQSSSALHAAPSLPAAQARRPLESTATHFPLQSPSSRQRAPGDPAAHSPEL